MITVNRRRQDRGGSRRLLQEGVERAFVPVLYRRRRAGDIQRRILYVGSCDLDKEIERDEARGDYVQPEVVRTRDTESNAAHGGITQCLWFSRTRRAMLHETGFTSAPWVPFVNQSLWKSRIFLLEGMTSLYHAVLHVGAVTSPVIHCPMIC